MNVGIICEYNPFHYGHLYHLNKIKELYPNCNIILVLSGWICERGDLSVMDKFKKAEIALKYGVDLIAELPYRYMQSADYFAKGALEILAKLNCDTLVFGSECNDIDKLYNVANIQINNDEFNKLVKQYTKEGINYPTALSKASKKILGYAIDTPNDLLGISYIKEIVKSKYNITPITIKRTSDFNSKKIQGKITSSSSIRELLKNKKQVKKYVPEYTHQYLNNPIFLDDYFNLIKYKIISIEDLTKYSGIDEKLNNRIHKCANSSNNIDELINSIKTKNYTYNRIKRILTYILFDITKEEVLDLNLNYVRILGFNDKGKKVLSKIKKNINIQILTNYDKKLMNKDLIINNILSINDKIKNKKKFIELEYNHIPKK